MMNRAMEHFEILNINEKPNFFVTHCDIPYKITDYTLDSYVKQMRLRVLDRLTETFGVDTSDAAIRKAVEEHNEVCRIISEIGEMRKAENLVITGWFKILNKSAIRNRTAARLRCRIARVRVHGRNRRRRRRIGSDTEPVPSSPAPFRVRHR